MMAYIFDIDGTLADCSHRLHHITGENKDWDAFYSECANDDPIEPVLEVLLDLQTAGATVYFVTGRPVKYMAETIKWLETYTGERVKGLWMRLNDDHRPDYIVKKEIYKTQIRPYCAGIDGVFENRKQCVDMWRSLGLTCYQVADGNY